MRAFSEFAEMHRLELMLGRVDFQDRKIGLRILANELRLELGTIVEIHLNLVGIGDDVIVGDDVTLFGIDDETRDPATAPCVNHRPARHPCH